MDIQTQLETERLNFRMPVEGDATDLLTFFSDDEAMRYLPSKRDMNGVHDWLLLVHESHRLHGYGPWALEQKSSGRFLGYCGLYLQKDVDGRDEVELLYGILRRHWHKGYAREAAMAVVNYAKTQFKIKRLISLIEPENASSIRVAKKTGMRLERSVNRWGKTYHLFSM